MDLNGTGQNTVTVESGSTVTGSFSMSHTASSGYCPLCLVQYYVRMNDVFTHCLTDWASGAGRNKISRLRLQQLPVLTTFNRKGLCITLAKPVLVLVPNMDLLL